MKHAIIGIAVLVVVLVFAVYAWVAIKFYDLVYNKGLDHDQV